MTRTPAQEALVALLPELKRELETLDYKRDFLKQIRLQTIIAAAKELAAKGGDACVGAEGAD